jgi:hypothetical protein
MFSTSDLFQFGYAAGEMSESTTRLEKREPEINLPLSQCAYTPFEVVIPKGLVKVVEDFDWE